MIGSHACEPLPRATRPSPTAAARARRQAVGRRRHGAADPGQAGLATQRAGRRGAGQAQAGHELGFLVRPQEQVDRRVAPPEDGLVVGPHGTTGEHDPQARPCLAQAGQGAHPPDHLLLGGLADGAAVDDHEVGRFEPRGFGATGRQEGAGHLLGVGTVHLAAQRPHVERRLGDRVGDELRERRLRHRLTGPGAGRRRQHVEHGQGAPAQAAPLQPIASSRPSAAARGTQVRASASCSVIVSPW